MSTGPIRPNRTMPFVALEQPKERSLRGKSQLPIDARLGFAVKQHVIPHLQALNRALVGASLLRRDIRDPAEGVGAMPPVSAIDESHVATLITLLETGTIAQRQAFYRSLVVAGIRFEDLCDDLLTSAARHLGECWLEDSKSFAEVSAMTTALQADLPWLYDAFNTAAVLPAHDHSILVFACPGDRHVLGAAMLTTMFEKAGWQPVHLASPTLQSVVRCLASEKIDMVAISVASTALLPDLKKLIAALRKASANPSVKVMVGGPAIPNLAIAERLGADATSFTGQEAMIQANMLLR
jgi:MerR family transcriptional regulator, light-induced transcriptional regulator